MYVILSKNVVGEAIVIDPCISEEAERLLQMNKIQSVTILLTHEHYDHISGVNWFREKYDCKVIANQKCAEAIQNPTKNRSKFFPVLFITHSQEVQDQVHAMNILPYSCSADISFAEKYEFEFSEYSIKMVTKLGHTSGSVCILIDQSCIFTGDTLLRTVPVLRKPDGNRTIYYEETIPWLKSLNKETMVYPGHGESGKISEMYLSAEGNA